MNTYIALLRGVNVGGHKKIPMAELRSFAADLGLADPRTLLQSGNLVFGSSDGDASALERTLEEEAAGRLGLTTTFFVRPEAEWRTVVDANPFHDAARDDPGHLLVLFLRDPPRREAMEALRAGIRGREVVRASDRQVYAVYPDGVGRSRLTNAVIERALGGPCTGRNWNTVSKLLGMLDARGRVSRDPASS